MPKDIVITLRAHLTNFDDIGHLKEPHYAFGGYLNIQTP
jgi:hypothetical protein